MNLHTFRPRADRDMARGNAVAARLRAQGVPALQVALQACDAQFGPAYQINGLKRRAERIIRMSYGHPEVRVRFKFYTGLFVAAGHDLDQACTVMRRASKSDKSGFGAELHLILRWLRFKNMHRDFAAMLNAERAQQFTLQAAE